MLSSAALIHAAITEFFTSFLSREMSPYLFSRASSISPSYSGLADHNAKGVPDLSCVSAMSNTYLSRV
ncbi:MAG: hypothetical protein IJQ37_00555 [Clostridia bacterium]|nr:hypothetical protein [Clostridia bacterium]